MILSKRTIKIVSWTGIFLPMATHLFYAEMFCRYDFFPSFIFICFLLLPAIIWQLRKSYIASIAASVGLLFWVVWENHIQCVSEDGPFVAGLGPIYLLVFGLFSSLVLGWFFGWIERKLHCQ